MWFAVAALAGRLRILLSQVTEKTSASCYNIGPMPANADALWLASWHQGLARVPQSARASAILEQKPRLLPAYH